MYDISILVTNALQREEIDKLKRQLKESHNSFRALKLEPPADLALSGSSTTTPTNGSTSGTYSRLLYVKVQTNLQFRRILL